jgi:hypothetical protein
VPVQVEGDEVARPHSGPQQDFDGHSLSAP